MGQHSFVAAVAVQFDVSAVPGEVVNGADNAGAHGFLLMAQTKVELAVISAAIARIAAGSRINMDASDS